jgi:hypothetical protein
MPSQQGKNEIYYFAVYDEVSHKLLYTKYNFNFAKYIAAFKLDPKLSQNDVFYHFIVENGHTFDKKFVVKENLKKYFDDITQEEIDYFNKYGYAKQENYMWGEVPELFVTAEEYILTQYDLIPYDNEQLRRLQDYIYIDNDGSYTKYNFEFDTYSADFNVWGNKLVVFTDFVIRTTYLNDIFISAYGYGYPLESFKKYFKQEPTLSDYLKDYSVTSVYANVDKSFPTIDFIKYREANPDLANYDVPTMKEHFYLYGQFERRPVKFTKQPNPLKDVANSIATIMTETGSATGFLFTGGPEFDIVDGKKQLYIVTCYHLFERSLNKNVMRAVITYDDGTLSYGESKTLTLEFKTIGYDMFTDLCVGLYDADLDYNKIFNSNLNVDLIPKLKIYKEERIKMGDTIGTIGNIASDDNLSYLEGSVIDPKYVGTFTDSYMLGIPASILAEIHSAKGMSGSPMFVFRNNEYRCVGMINSGMGPENQYALGISGFNMNLVVNNTISRWFVYGPLYKSNIKLLNFFIKDGYPKRWLGARCSYYHQKVTPSKFKAFNNFNYNGGLVLEDFVLGFNYINKTFIYDTLELSKQGAVEFKSALINTKMYEKFIYSSRTPIVIKSIYFFENVHSNTSRYFMGKYGNQVGLDVITYGLGQVSTVLNEPGFTNRVRRQYPTIEIEFYYYDGNEWKLDKEKVGGNTPDWYLTTTDPIGNKFYEHRFDVPSVLIPYIDVYARSFVQYTQTQGMCTQGIGTQGIGTQGIGTQGIGTQGIGIYGIGTQGIGTQGIGTQGIGTQGIGTQGIGTQGIGTQGIGTQGIGTQSMSTQIKR